MKLTITELSLKYLLYLLHYGIQPPFDVHATGCRGGGGGLSSDFGAQNSDASGEVFQRAEIALI